MRQSTNEVLMVAPTAFGFNEQAAQDNSFMHAAAKPGEGSGLTREVLREFAGLHRALTDKGVQVGARGRGRGQWQGSQQASMGCRIEGK